jgi:hypothetical protein
LEFNHSIACAAYPYAEPYFGGILAAYPAQAMFSNYFCDTGTVWVSGSQSGTDIVRYLREEIVHEGVIGGA